MMAFFIKLLCIYIFKKITTSIKCWTLWCWNQIYTEMVIFYINFSTFIRDRCHKKFWNHEWNFKDCLNSFRIQLLETIWCQIVIYYNSINKTNKQSSKNLGNKSWKFRNTLFNMFGQTSKNSKTKFRNTYLGKKLCKIRRTNFENSYIKLQKIRKINFEKNWKKIHYTVVPCATAHLALHCKQNVNNKQRHNHKQVITNSNNNIIGDMNYLEYRQFVNVFFLYNLQIHQHDIFIWYTTKRCFLFYLLFHPVFFPSNYFFFRLF